MNRTNDHLATVWYDHRETFSMSRNKSHNLDISCIALQLC